MMIKMMINIDPQNRESAEFHLEKWYVKVFTNIAFHSTFRFLGGTSYSLIFTIHFCMSLFRHFQLLICLHLSMRK